MTSNSTIVESDLEYIASTPLDWESFCSKTILISGAGGFLASYLARSLVYSSDRYNLSLCIVLLVRQHPSSYPRLHSISSHPCVRFLQQSVCEPILSQEYKFDYIVHAASKASPALYGIDPVGVIEANVLGTHYLLLKALQDKSRFLFLSAGEIYGIQPSASTLTITESSYGIVDPSSIRSCYAESKRLGENLCMAYWHQYQLHTTIVRPFHIYGPTLDLSDGRVHSDFVSNIVNSEAILLKSDGSHVRPFCYIADATLAFLNILMSGDPGAAYNIANSSCAISILDLAKLLISIFPERSPSIRFVTRSSNDNYLVSPVSHFLPSTERLFSHGWSPRFHLKEGFTRTVLSFLHN